MDTLRNIARSVYDDLSPLALSLSRAASDLVSTELSPADRDSALFVSKLVKTNQGQDLLSSYRMALFQVREVNHESIRIGALCSVRMSAVQQTMNEEYEAVGKLETLLNQLPKITEQLNDMNKQLGDLHRHLLQLELSFAVLDSTASNNSNNSPNSNTSTGQKNSSIIDLN